MIPSCGASRNETKPPIEGLPILGVTPLGGMSALKADMGRQPPTATINNERGAKKRPGGVDRALGEPTHGGTGR